MRFYWKGNLDLLHHNQLPRHQQWEDYNLPSTIGISECPLAWDGRAELYIYAEIKISIRTSSRLRPRKVGIGSDLDQKFQISRSEIKSTISNLPPESLNCFSFFRYELFSTLYTVIRSVSTHSSAQIVL